MLTCLKLNCDFQVSDADFLKMHEQLVHSQLPQTAVEDLVRQLDEQLKDATVSNLNLKLGPKQSDADLLPDIFSVTGDSEVKIEPSGVSTSPPMKRTKPASDLKKTIAKPRLFSNSRLNAGNIHQVLN